MGKSFWFIFAGNTLRSTGKTLSSLDSDNKGEDDVIGGLLDGGGKALIAYGQNNLKDFKGYLKAVADGIYSYLGIEIPGQELSWRLQKESAVLNLT